MGSPVLPGPVVCEADDSKHRLLISKLFDLPIASIQGHIDIIAARGPTLALLIAHAGFPLARAVLSLVSIRVNYTRFFLSYCDKPPSSELVQRSASVRSGDTENAGVSPSDTRATTSTRKC